MDQASKAPLYLLSYRKNLLFLSMVLGSGSLVCLVLYADPRFYSGKGHWVSQYNKNNPVSVSATEKTKFLTDDLIKKMDKSIKEVMPCTSHPLLNSDKTHIWIEEDNLAHYNVSDRQQVVCCYRSFYRPNSIDDITSSSINMRVKYTKCRFFNSSTKVDNKDEFVRVTCRQTKKGTILFDSFFLFARKKKIDTKPKKYLEYNVLLLGIDGVSRLNLHRTMPKTVEVLNKLGAVELLRYNKVGDNTFPNLMPLLLGRNETELKRMCWPHQRFTFDSCPFIWEWYLQAGYSTALGEDSANLGVFDYLRNRGFAGTPTTYYLYTFMHEAERAGSKNQTFLKTCMNEKYFYKILLDYVEDLTAVIENKLFGFFWEISMSHDNLNWPLIMDDSYRDFFRRLISRGYLDKTIIILISDHGMRFGEFRKTRQGYLEERLPFVFALLPPSFRKNYSEAYNNLKINIHRLATPYDVHATLLDLLDLDNIKNAKIISRAKESYSTKRGISLFLPIPRNRTCKSAAIDDHWCVDFKNVEVGSNSSEANDAIEHVILHLNSLLDDYPQCAKLSLSKVLIVTRVLSDILKKNNESIELTVGFQTSPGDGEFEATLEREGGPGSSWSISGSVSRLNVYGNQSYCAPTHELKLYCYCTDTMWT